MNGQQTGPAVGLFLHEFYMSISRMPAVVLIHASFVICPYGLGLKAPHKIVGALEPGQRSNGKLRPQQHNEIKPSLSCISAQVPMKESNGTW
jgi:hypothetical protein